MMIRTIMRGVVAWILIAVAVAGMGGPAQADHRVSYYPITGDFWYDGQFFADSYLRWNTPGGWATTFPGYEHDLVLDPFFMNVCTSWTNLPYGYDDCGTAGILEENDEYVFSFGSFRAATIEPFWTYYGSWSFYNRGVVIVAPMKLIGQETYRQWCANDNVWCMGSTTHNQDLLSGSLRRSRTAYGDWNFH